MSYDDKTKKNDDGKITSFKEFKDLLDKFEDNNSGRMFYFRGEHSFYEYSIPSIYRDSNTNNDSKDDNNFKNGIASESDKFYSDLLVHLGDLGIFNMQYSNQLAKFQHYQAPTRLLDITANPLIALFFALEDTGSNRGKNRTIYFYAVDKNEIKYQDGHTVNMEVTANWMNQKLVHDFMQQMRTVDRNELIKDYRDRSRDNDMYRLNDSHIYRVRYTYDEIPTDLHSYDYEDRFKDDGIINNRIEKNYVNDFMEELNRKDKLPEDMTRPSVISYDLNRSYFANFIRESDRMKRQQGAFIMPKYLTRLENIDDIENKDKDLFTEIRYSPRSEQKKRIDRYFNRELYRSIILATRPKYNRTNELSNDFENYYNKENHSGFRRYTIPSEFVDKMRKEINALGVNAGFVYPDIEHYSQFLIDSYNQR